MRVFLLSPASSHGRRARLLFNESATFELARKVRTRRGAPLGEVFGFLSGLYFRGKLAYAQAFARTPRPMAGVHIITPSRGLVSPHVHITLTDLREFAAVPIDLAEPRYREPLESCTQSLAEQIARARSSQPAEVVLLGSIASDKYLSVLTRAFDTQLRFPHEFVGRGDMSRGGLLLRCVDDGQELTYIPLAGAVRHGARPPRLEKRPGILKRVMP
ncbi:MAG: hypothetical protein ACRENP_11400 [Longimicrobiales bacterium]